MLALNLYWDVPVEDIRCKGERIKFQPSIYGLVFLLGNPCLEALSNSHFINIRKMLRMQETLHQKTKIRKNIYIMCMCMSISMCVYHTMLHNSYKCAV